VCIVGMRERRMHGRVRAGRDPMLGQCGANVLSERAVGRCLGLHGANPDMFRRCMCELPWGNARM